ncbi:hypothetical protein [Microcoleus vaginatus]|uniref:hypothetical protein n=1 Tax=Microcoleus vaginatus TaxID=119532 RepID=UPI001F61BE99
MLQRRLEIDGKVIGFYLKDNGEKLLLPDELPSALEAESQCAAELDSLLARYRDRFGQLPESNG